MSRYPNRDRARYFGALNDPSNPSILFDDPTFGTRSVLEQASGVNQVLDPGMPFGTPPFLSLPDPQLSTVGIGAALQAPNITLQSSAPASSAAASSWKKPVIVLGLILVGYGLYKRLRHRG